ncbi:MAG: capsid protein precursor [Porcupine astrovirus 5]|nr:MAG: capsid protein precursor [Porcupine astrovirus 5]ULF48011.1 MAG: capsid protein precursor [Porcupine astrovirus 5]
MANRQQKRGPRTTTNIVVRNGTAAPQARASGLAAGNRRRRSRARRRTQVSVRVLPSQNQGRRRFPRRQGVGSRIVFQKINSTLGTVGSNGSEQIECELTCLMNPATMKEATGSNSFTPLGIYASTYSLFRMTKCTLVLKPLVGDSAVSGTVIRASWNPTSTPTQTSWSALGARKHTDVTPGKTGRFTLTSRDLVGPKGGWFKTNTKGDPMMSFAGTLEVHTLGKTMSTYKNDAFTGGLFLAELETHWQFKDYSQQPGMLNLIKGEDTQQSHIRTNPNGKIQLIVPATTRMARAATGGTSEIIWLVTDTIIQAGAAALPPPFGWLIRGGWWLVKKAAGISTRNGEIVFDVYASISDARADMPCISTEANMTPIPVGGLHFQQVTPGNTGIATETYGTRAIAPDTTLTSLYVIRATQQHFPSGSDSPEPPQSRWVNPSNNQISQNGFGFMVGSQRWGTHNLLSAHVAFSGGYQQFTHCVPVYFMYPNNQPLAGYAVGYIRGSQQDSPTLRVQSILFQATRDHAYNFSGEWRVAHVTYPAQTQSNNYQARLEVMAGATTGIMRNKVVAGEWYVIQFVNIGIVGEALVVGGVELAYKATADWPTETRTFTPSVADADAGLIPAYCSGLVFEPFRSSDISITTRATVVNLPLNYDVNPSFGCDDSTESPLPPSNEDLTGGAREFEPFSDSYADSFLDLEDDDDGELELGLDDHYSDPPISRLVVRDDASALYEQLRATHSERAARLAVNQLYPSDEYTEFTEVYHDALADGLSPRAARAHALGL